MSAGSTSVSAEYSAFPGSTPSVSANGTSNGIVWNLITQNFGSKGNASLQAHDATNVSRLLYSSDQNLSRDNPGAAVKFAVPTVVNGKVYVGAESQVSVFGLLNGATQAAAPAITPANKSFTSSVSVTMTDSTPGASIHYTTNGATPTAASPTYTAAITVTSTETIRAIAIATGHLDSNISSATYTKSTQAAMPTFSPSPGTYSTAQHVSIASSTSGATIYYTTSGATPTTSSTKYTGAITISATATLKAIATAPNLANSAVATGLYTIQTTPTTARPSFNPAPGTYSTTQHVALVSTTSGATIYYTTNGSTPTTSSTKYTGPITISSTTTIKAIAAAPNLAVSGVSSGLFTIQAAAAPAGP
jgi:hypothetical protein